MAFGLFVWVVGVGVAAAVAGKTHSKRLAACSLLRASDVSAVVGYQVGSKSRPDTVAFEPGGVISDCLFTESHPADPANGGRFVDFVVLQRNFSKRSSKWNTGLARKQFDYMKGRTKPFVVVGGIGDAAFWDPSAGILNALSGDLVLQISGQTGRKQPPPVVTASRSVDVGLIRTALKRA